MVQCGGFSWHYSNATEHETLPTTYHSKLANAPNKENVVMGSLANLYLSVTSAMF